jgi:hypothetical protein
LKSQTKAEILHQVILIITVAQVKQGIVPIKEYFVIQKIVEPGKSARQESTIITVYLNVFPVVPDLRKLDPETSPDISFHLGGAEQHFAEKFGEAVGLACDIIPLCGISTVPAPKGQHVSRWGNAPSYRCPPQLPPSPERAD